MSSRLLDHEPEIYSLLAAPAARQGAAAELAQAVELLEELELGEPEAWLVDLIDGAAPRRLARPHAVALAGAMGWLARRALRRGDARHVGAVGRAFGLELEGLSAEDQWFELSRHFLRLARRAAAAAARQPAALTPVAAAGRALQLAAREHAPGLLPWLAAQRAAGPFLRGRDPAVLDPLAPPRLAATVRRPLEGA